MPVRRNTKLPVTGRQNAAAFLESYDDSVAVPKAIKAGLAALAKIGRDEWRYENQFCIFAKVSTNKIGAFREQFADHIVETSGRNPRNAWFADKAVAKRMRDALAKNAQ